MNTPRTRLCLARLGALGVALTSLRFAGLASGECRFGPQRMPRIQPPVLQTSKAPGAERMRSVSRADVRISGRVRKAIEAMVWSGRTRAEAAADAGIADDTLYRAFRKPEVKAAYLAECDVLRTSARSRAITRLIGISEENDGMPAVQAIRTLFPDFENPDAAARSSDASRMPGVTIRVVQEVPAQPAPRSAPLVIDVTPSNSASFD